MFHDALVWKLKLDFLFTHFTIASTQAPLEVLSVAPDALIAKTPDELIRTLKDQLGDQPLNWPQTASLEVEVQAASLCSIQLGTISKFGVVVAGSRRPDFPNQSERMLLDVTANRAAIDLQQAISVDEHKQLAQRNATLI